MQKLHSSNVARENEIEEER